MKLKTEAARLFFAVLALILVGMLSGSLGGSLNRTYVSEPGTSKKYSRDNLKPVVKKESLAIKKNSGLANL